jgi:hypothetical protein
MFTSKQLEGDMSSVLFEFWNWYESAPWEEKGRYDLSTDYGRYPSGGQSTEQAWEILEPQPDNESAKWRAYPAELKTAPEPTRMIQADDYGTLRRYMAAFEAAASAWDKES